MRKTRRKPSAGTEKPPNRAIWSQLNYAQKLLAEGIASDNRESILKAREWFKKAHGQYAGLKEAAYGIGLSYVKIQGLKGGSWHGTRLANESRESP